MRNVHRGPGHRLLRRPSLPRARSRRGRPRGPRWAAIQGGAPGGGDSRRAERAVGRRPLGPLLTVPQDAELRLAQHRVEEHLALRRLRRGKRREDRPRVPHEPPLAASAPRPVFCLQLPPLEAPAAKLRAKLTSRPLIGSRRRVLAPRSPRPLRGPASFSLGRGNPGFRSSLSACAGGPTEALANRGATGAHAYTA